jgi:hypothetical protein
MAVDFATLALRVDNTDAVKKLDDTGRALDNVGAKAKATTVTVEQSRLAWQRSGGDMTKFGQELQKIAGVHDAVAVATTRSTAAAEKHHLSIGRVNMALEGLASEALGANSRIGSLAAKFSEFGIGSIETAGILAGIAAIALAWDKLNESTRKANEETQKAIGLLRDLRIKKLLGPGGETGDAVEKAKAQLPTEILTLDQLKAGRATFTDNMSIRALQLDAEIRTQSTKVSELKALISDGEDEVVRLKKEAADKAAADRQTAFDKEYEAWKEQINRIVDLAKNASDPLAKLLYDADAPARASERSKELDKLGLGVATGSAFGRTRQQAALQEFIRIDPIIYENLGKVGLKSAGAAVELERLMNVAKKVREDEARNASLRETGTSFGLNLLSQTGKTGSLLSGAIGAGLSASAGGPWAMAAAGAASLTENIITFGKAARDQAEKLTQTSRMFVTEFGLYYRQTKGVSSPLDEKLTQAKLTHDAYANQINDLYAGKKYEAYRNELLHMNDVAYQRNIENIRKQTGALDELSGAMANIVEGYRLQATIFKASHPRRAPFTPTGPNINPSVPSTPLSGDLTVPLYIDGQQIGSAVIRNFRARSQAQTGDASNWTELRPT